VVRQNARPRRASGRFLDGLTRDELEALPAAVDLVTGGKAFGMGRTKSYQLAREGQFPVPVLRLGGAYRVRTADLLAKLGIEAPAAGNDAA
jgi:hypothetical protein